MFFFTCSDCKKNRLFYDNGEEHIVQPTICKKCASKKVKEQFTKTDTQYITTETCEECGYIYEDILEKSFHKEEEPDPKFEEDKARFCLDDKRLASYLDGKRSLKALSDMVRKDEEKKQNAHLYDMVANMQKLDIIGLKKHLILKMEKTEYSSPEVSNPVISSCLTVDLTVYTGNFKERDFQKFMFGILDGTNWALMKSSISEKLGVVQCKLQGYKNEDDLVRLVEQRIKKSEKT